MTEDKARDRAESGDSGRERNAVIRAQEPAADRMGFFNGLLGPITGQLGKIEPIVALRSGEGGDGMGHGAVSASPDQVSRPVLLFGVYEHALCGPPCVNSVLAIRNDPPAVRIFRAVVHFAGILDHIEKLAGLEFVIVVQLPRAAADHAGGLISKEPDVLGEDFVGPVGNRSFAPQETGEAPHRHIG